MFGSIERKPELVKSRLQKFCTLRVALESLLERLFADQSQALIERQHSRHGSGVVVFAFAPELPRSSHVQAPVRHDFGAFGDKLKCRGRESDDRDPRHSRESLLSTGEHEINLPLVHGHRQARHSDDGVDHDHQAKTLRETADLLSVCVHDPTGCFTVHDREHVIGFLFELRSHLFHMKAVQGLWEKFGHLSAETTRDVCEASAEGAEVEHQNSAPRPHQRGHAHLHRR